MNLSKDQITSNYINLVLEDLIGLDDFDKLEFKSTLNNHLNKTETFNEDSLFIILELIYKLKNYNLTYYDAFIIISDLINSVNEYNSDKKYDLKYKRLFYRQYLFEIQTVIDYVEESYSENNSHAKSASDEFNSKNIKKNLSHLSKEDLCYILGLNFELTFESEKSLKNILCNRLIVRPFDFSILNEASPDDIKNYLDNPDELKKYPFKSNEAHEVIKKANKWLYDIQYELENNFNLDIDDFSIREMKRQDEAFIRKIKAKKRMGENTQTITMRAIEREKIIRRKEKEIYQQSLSEQARLDEKRRKQRIELENELKRIKNERNAIEKHLQEQKEKERQENQRKQREIASKNRERIDERIKEHQIKFNELLEEIRIFNDKPFSEMVALKDYAHELYVKLHKYQNHKDYKSSDEINRFYEYYHSLDNFNKMNSIKQYESDFENFVRIFNMGIYFDYEKRQNLIEVYSDIYKIILGFGDTLLDKLYSEIKYLKEFKIGYSDLIEYTNFNDTKNGNIVKKINQRYIDNNISNNEEFFEDISDPAKKAAIIMDDKNIKVIAGAGTGKTFTIQNKVKYLIEHKNVNPEKILCLCYTHKSASELDERVNNSLDDANVEVCTFHEFARRVDRDCGGIKSTNRYLLDDVIRNYIKDIIKDSKKANQLMEYFAYYINPNVEEKFETFKDFLDKRKFVTLQQKYLAYGVEDETLKGENVRSLGELIIANYLFMHDINYEYEARYERNHFSKFVKDRFLYSGKYFSMNEFSKKSKKDIVEHFIRYEHRKAAYKPDFYLPDYEIFLEHFGVNENGEVTWLKGEEKEQYERLMESKRVWHEMYGTKLIETYSYYVRDEILIEELEKLLKENKVAIGERPKEEILKMLLINNKVGVYNGFSKLIKNFINIFEANNFPKSKLDEFKKQNNLEPDLFTRRRQELFLSIVSEIYEIYYELNQSNDIDHNREISNALERIKNKEYTRKFDYILIDEYQDINYIRCKLIQELQKNSDAHVFVVGDDWQSIYGFGGSDVSLFIDFEKYFPNSEKISLTENRRNSKTLNIIAKKFIEENPKQDRKRLTCLNQNKNLNPIRLVSYSDQKYSKALSLDAILKDILSHNDNDNLKILLLGRMNEDIEGYINNRLFKEKSSEKFRKIIYSRDKSLDITFMSIHQSKGLEYDEVILLNLEDDVKGFPSQIVDDPILNFVKKNNESYPFAEERRLFYVALTRTKNNIYILYPKDSPSVFVKNLKNQFNLEDTYLKRDYDISQDVFEDNQFFNKIERYPTDLECPECGDGKIIIVANNDKKGRGIRSVFVGCSNYPECEYIAGPYHASIDDMKYIEKCPNCKGILVRYGDVLKCSMNYHGGCMETRELKLDEDDLKYKDYEK